MANFIETTVTTTHIGSELVSDLLWQYTDLGVFVLDIEDVLDLERQGKTWDYTDDSVYSADKRVFVKAFFPVKKADKIIAELERDLMDLKARSEFDLGSLEIIKREIDGDLWHEQWKEHFKPIHINNVVIVPEWIDYKAQKGETKVLLDSNMAFGTGEHETTSMCIEYLSENVKSTDTVLDVGCGSGILGITASKLGAKKVIMTDIDECAIKATNHNMQLNGIDNGVVYLKNLLDDNRVKGEIIVANIVADVLIGFSKGIMNNLKSEGKIILSGILSERLEEVKKAYLDAGFTFISEKVKGEWSALLLKGKK